MLFPLVAADTNDVVAANLDGGMAIPTGITSILVVIVLIMPERVLQVSRGPEGEGQTDRKHAGHHRRISK
jgi:hypothetical protein